MDISRNKILKRIQNTLANISVDTTNIHFGVGNPQKPHHSPGKYVDENTKYIVLISEKNRVFVVWNYSYRKSNKATLDNFDLSKEWSVLKDGSHPITFPYYRQIKCGNEYRLEKVYVVDFKDYRDFFLNIDQYMEFNEYDIDENGKPIVKTIGREPKSTLENNERKRYSSSRLQRDYNFRVAVLKAYNNQCAICRTENEAVLQAAHLHGYEVAKTDLNADNPRNGICLCANHHLMYDDYYFEIDVSDLQIVINDFRIENESWYTHFMDKNGYDGKIIKRND